MGGVKTLVHQSLVPSKLSSQSLCFAKQTQGSPYQATFRDLHYFYSSNCIVLVELYDAMYTPSKIIKIQN